jgi:hypothetical protein
MGFLFPSPRFDLQLHIDYHIITFCNEAIATCYRPSIRCMSSTSPPVT